MAGPGTTTLPNFYPRSPCGERRLNLPSKPIDKTFLSTLSLRRATHLEFCGTAQHTYFYPRSPCGERRLDDILAGVNELLISIHALLAESDQPTTSRNDKDNMISIHALLAESDNINNSVSTADKISIHALLAESDLMMD